MCNVSFHIVVVTVVIGSVCNITSAHKTLSLADNSTL